MSDQNSPGRRDTIRITARDLADPRVDDLIKRHMSLRGETGITRDRGRRWYFQNWFVFMIAGALAAFAAWAVLEPNFDDTLYVQGKIEHFTRAGVLSEYLEGAAGEIRASFKINGDQIILMRETRLLNADHSIEKLDVDTLDDDQTVGVYVDVYPLEPPDGYVGIATHLIKAPPETQATAETLERLSARSAIFSLLVFPLVAGFVGMAIGAADGIVCRLPRRMFLAGALGLVVGFLGGFVSGFIAGLVYTPISALASANTGDAAGGFSTLGFITQMGGRGLAWAIAGMTAGLGQGIALRSGRLVLYGLLGGLIGGLLGGLLFDPIDFLIVGEDRYSAHWSRMVGFTIIGAGVGAMIGIVELLSRDAWLRMTAGPLAGKEFLLFKDTMRVGASPKSDIYLFNDPAVVATHAIIRAVGDHYEIEGDDEHAPVAVNQRPVRRMRLRHGDQIGIGRTVFVFQSRKG